MGVVIPQVITEDKAGGAQVIDGSLRFDSSKSQYLSRTFSAGNRKTWTWSGWVKRASLAASSQVIFGTADASTNNNSFAIRFNSSHQLEIYDLNPGFNIELYTTQVFRDVNSWGHLVVAVDTTQGTASNRVKVYWNGNQITAFSTATYPSPNLDLIVNYVRNHSIGRGGDYDGIYFNGLLSNIYFIDGQALGPEYFGYTDPLTNTWRPKKYVNTTSLPGDSGGAVGFGTNGFYLPLDGNTPIGQNRSGNVGINTWTPVNFGGSNTIEKATGALPILNTDGGGKVARVGVRTDSNASSLVLALPLVGIKNDFSNKINGGTTEKVITANGDAAGITTISNFYGGSFRFDGTGDYLRFDASTDTNLSGDFTVEAWVYPTTNGEAFNSEIVSRGAATSNNGWHFGLIASSTTVFFGLNYAGTGATVWTQSTNSIPLNTWSHIAATRSGNTLRIFLNGVLDKENTGFTGTPTVSGTEYVYIGRASYDEGSREFNGYIQDVRIYKDLAKYTQNFIPASTDPDILPDTPSGVAYSSNVTPIPSTDGGSIALNGTGDYLKTVGASSDFAMGTGNFTVEMFIYPQTIAVSSPGILSWSSTEGTSSDYTNAGFIAYGSNGTIDVLLGTNSSYASISTPTSGPLLKFDSWNHIAIVRDTGNTFRVFVNGELAVTDTSTLASTNITAQYMNFGAYYTGTNYMVRGFISNVHVVKGTALYSSNFTPPIVGIASTTNTKLLFAKSGISTTATEVTPSGVTIGIAGTAKATNFNPFTVNINTQRGQESGYATLNPLSSASNFTISNGNLKSVDASSTISARQYANTSISSGKYYFETTIETASSTTMTGFAVNTGLTNGYPGSLSTDWTYHSSGLLYNNGNTTSTTAATSAGDVIGNAIDMDTGKIWFSVNGNFVGGGVPSTGTNASFSSVTGTITPVFRPYASTISVNFGQKPFKFPPPAGFQPLALANTPRPTIVRPDQYVGIVTYNGNNTTNVIRGYNFKPDMVWLKARNNSGNGYDNIINDSVRGAGKNLVTNTRNAGASPGGEYQSSANTDFVSFDNGGFTLGSVNQFNGINNANNIVAWAWKAGGSGGGNSFWKDDVGYATTTAAGLTGGTINPTGASVNTKSGFSIITYTGNGTNATVPHGLGRKPSLTIIKNLDDSSSWPVFTDIIDGSMDQLYLDTTDAKSDQASLSALSTTTFSILSGSGSGASTKRYVAYVWAEIPGFSKFGVYTGNNSADGPLINLGFKPALFMHKDITTGGANRNWLVWDKERNSYNPMGTIGFWNLSTGDSTDSSSTGHIIDFVSNGVKIRNNNTNINPSSTNFIYAAWAETPSFNLYGGQANAR